MRFYLVFCFTPKLCHLLIQTISLSTHSSVLHCPFRLLLPYCFPLLFLLLYPFFVFFLFLSFLLSTPSAFFSSSSASSVCFFPLFLFLLFLPHLLYTLSLLFLVHFPLFSSSSCPFVLIPVCILSLIFPSILLLLALLLHLQLFFLISFSYLFFTLHLLLIIFFHIFFHFLFFLLSLAAFSSSSRCRR